MAFKVCISELPLPFSEDRSFSIAVNCDLYAASLATIRVSKAATWASMSLICRLMVAMRVDRSPLVVEVVPS